jgi:hypothetical protein
LPPVDCPRDPVTGDCIKHIDCPEKEGFTLRAIENGECVYDPICKSDEHLENGKCVKCPDGSQPDNNGNCPIKIIDNNTTAGGNNNESKTLSLSISILSSPKMNSLKCFLR